MMDLVNSGREVLLSPNRLNVWVGGVEKLLVFTDVFVRPDYFMSSEST